MISVLLRTELEADTQSNSTTTIDLLASMNWVIMTAESKNRKNTTTAILPSTGVLITTRKMVIITLLKCPAKTLPNVPELKLQ